MTPDQVLAALAALGRPAVMLNPPTEDDMPTLLGALLGHVEAALLPHSGPESTEDIFSGYIRAVSEGADAAGRGKYVTLLLAHRIGRTRIELNKILDQVDSRGGSARRDFPLLDVARYSAHAANTALVLHFAGAYPHSMGADPVTDPQESTKLREIRLAVQQARQSYEEAARPLRHKGKNV